MGHILLATMPNTEAWREVAGLLDSNATDEDVIRASAVAAEGTLNGAAQDPALAAAVHLLAMVPRAAQDDRFEEKLAALEVKVPAAPGLGDLVVGISLAFEQGVRRAQDRSDFGEIVRRALLGSLISFSEDVLSWPFEASADETRAAVAKLAQPEAFTWAAHAFFARLTADTLGYWLDRTLSTRVGPGKRFGSIGDRDAFDHAIDEVCAAGAVIIREFAEDWYRLRIHQDGSVTPERAAIFGAVAFRRIGEEIGRHRGVDA